MTFAQLITSFTLNPKQSELIMLSLLFFVACFETSNPTQPTQPTDPEPSDPIVTDEGGCSESASSIGWDESSPEAISMKEFMEAIPESFNTQVVLNEQYDYPTCLNVSLIPDTSSLEYITSEYVPPTGDVSNSMMPICLNYFTVHAELALVTEEGALDEHIDVKLQLRFEEDGSYSMFAQAELSEVTGAVGNILDGQEIEGIYMHGLISENTFDGGIYASTVEYDDDIVIATQYALAQWSGAPQEECE